MDDLIFLGKCDYSVLKLYNDKITFGSYNRIGEPEYKWLNPRYKVRLATGEIIEHDINDARRVGKNFKSSLSRTLRTIYEISRKNEFKYFLTFTFNQAYVDRKSARACYTVFRNIIKRLKYKYGEIEYLEAPEFHKDKSIHFHLMCNFLDKLPKLKYKGITDKGEAFYTIQDNFKKADCYITVEKLKTNNTDYLVKYFTKSGEFPLTRRFSCSRNLKRSRMVESVKVKAEDFRKACEIVKKNGFVTKFRNSSHVTFAYEENTPRGACDAGVDLFRINIKDENLSDIQFIWGVILGELGYRDTHFRKISTQLAFF